MDVSKKLTRKDFECPIFGPPKDLPVSKLPTYEDVLRCCFNEHYNITLKTNKTFSFSEVVSIVAPKVKALYDKASIPTVTNYRIIQLIISYHDSYRKLMKSFKRDKEKETFQKKVAEFKAKALFLFDIAACKCTMTYSCSCQKVPEVCDCECPISISCKCNKTKKIPSLELKFMYFQRNFGKGKIGGVDVKETKKIIKRNERKLTQQKKSSIQLKTQPSCSESVDMECSSEEVDNEMDQNYELSDSESGTNLPDQMRTKLKNTALTCDRFGISDRAAAAVVSSVLKDVGIVTDDDRSHVVDKCKIRREKKAIRREFQNQSTEERNLLQGLYFDGRKDNTLVIEKVNQKHFRRTIQEEHYSIIQEPRSVYVGHVTPSSGSAQNICNSIISHLTDGGFSLDELDVLGCDGTVTNTGWRTGVIRLIEKQVKRPLQWAICLLHFNELPFRHLFQTLDGGTTGPKSFSGPIGIQLSKCEKLPIVDFESVDCEVPDIDPDILSNDQQYLLLISSAIKLGNIPIDLAVREPGPLSHSRWLTTANRILRLYVSVKTPSNELKMLVSFILKSYMPVWFKIKKSKYLTDGPGHIFEVIKSTRFLPEKLLRVIDPVIERNAFFAHPENLLLRMMVDERKHIRELGFRKILKARKLVSKTQSIRSFRPPNINFQATDYIEIINWTNTDLTPPPLLRRVTDDEIWAKITAGETADEWNFGKFPCHTQAVERCVKLVTEASKKVVGAKSRDGFIRSTLASRAAMPKFSSKCSFNLPTQKL